MDEVLCKGVNFRGVLAACESLLGGSIAEEVEAKLTGEFGDHLRTGRVLASSWYPIAWYVELHETIARVTGRGPRVAGELAARAVEEDFSGVYRALLMVLKPERLFRWGPRVFSTYWRGPQLEVLEARPGLACARYTGMRGASAAVWMDLFMSSERALELCGALAVRRREILGGGPADEHAEVEYRWALG